MDLFEALQAKPSRLEIKHPGTGEGTGLFIDLVSASDPKVKAAEREYLDEIRAKAVQGGERVAPDTQKLARLKARASVVGWEFTGDANWKGKQPEFSEALADELLANEKVFEQVIIHMADDRNFFPA
jgi:hypothetical protein